MHINNSDHKSKKLTTEPNTNTVCQIVWNTNQAEGTREESKSIHSHFEKHDLKENLSLPHPMSYQFIFEDERDRTQKESCLFIRRPKSAALYSFIIRGRMDTSKRKKKAMSVHYSKSFTQKTPTGHALG
ncbi:hypothetical protein CEXT_779771 [Caerostris extrusa]|uniref:Uncharacterized protein n=1 Tax=Caerostris extrusa TaxID=172846 RepID=A0AAV4Y5G1_CAEEX|nr:hypothetical protein CEXT_779771 [Caerostris extrusa]